TAFTDCLAVPHTIGQHAEVSFICVIHNDVPLQWTNNKVNFILMIGITQNDMKYFNDAFNLLIEFFLSPDNQIKLLSTKNFSDFVNTLLPMN
ncbi:MAG: PTS sugar transporter subunit IIA, partial [Enterococcus sp.]